MSRLAIVGASGHGRVVADAAQAGGWQEVEFFDDCWPHVESTGAWEVKGRASSLMERIPEYHGVVVAVGANDVRAGLQVQLEQRGAIFATIIHPRAAVSQYASIGTGSVVLAGAVVNAGAVVGRGVILNTACSVDHDCVLNDFVHVSPGAHLAGNVHVGTRTWIGIGAAIRQAVEIGSDVVVGAGAVVVSNVASGLRVVGVPARALGG